MSCLLSPKHRRQRMLNFAQWDLAALCDEIRQELFPELTLTPSVRFLQKSTLANIIRQGEENWTISLHAVLNCGDVPLCVFTYILKHELLHMEIRPQEISGRLVDHPPEFFQRERQITPERDEAKHWIWRNLGDRLRVRPRLECIKVKPYRPVYRSPALQQKHVVGNSGGESAQLIPGCYLPL